MQLSSIPILFDAQSEKPPRQGKVEHDEHAGGRNDADGAQVQAGAVAAHAGVLAIWVACVAILVGVGLITHRCVFGLPYDRAGLFAPLWTGLAVTTLVLQVWHFVFPVDGRVLLIITAAGVTGLAVAMRRPAWPAVVRPPSGAEAVRVLVFLAIGLWLANLSLAPLTAYDTGVYMIPGVEWTKAYPVVPGIGALYGRLAYNSSNVLLGSLLESGPWQPAAPHLLSGFFLFVLAGRIASRFPAGIWMAPRSRLARSRPESARMVLASTFDLLLLTPLVAIALDDQLLPSLSSDVSVAVALFAGASLLLGRLVNGPADKAGPSAMIGAASAFTVALTFKLSAAVFGFFGCCIAFTVMARDVRAGRLSRRAAVIVASLCTLLVCTWMARGVVGSGYPLYPSPLMPAPVGWKVPLEQAQAETGFVAHFGRTWYSTDLANADSVAEFAWRRFHWLRPWAGALARGRDQGIVSLAFACAIVFGIGLSIRWGHRPDTRRVCWLFLPATAGLLFWFVAAPRPSFGIAAAWVLAALTGALFVSRLRARAALRSAVVIALLLPIVPAAVAVRHDYPGESGTITAWRWTLVRDADPHDWFREPDNTASVSYTTGSGLVLRRPTEQSLCRRAPLPCTPTPSPNLRLREPGNPGAGFVIDGPWQAERWPNSGRFLESWRRARRADK